MAVSANSLHVLQHNGRSIYFCNAGFKSKFVANPAKYMANINVLPIEISEEKSAVIDSIHMVYTCPMHPEVRQDLQSSCPKCGMALEPEMPSDDAGENPELINFKQRFIWTLPLSVIVAFLAMVDHRLQWFEMAAQI
jgi:Cu+-exporting ATPase